MAKKPAAPPTDLVVKQGQGSDLVRRIREGLALDPQSRRSRLVADFLKGMSPNTVEAYNKDLDQFALWLGLDHKAKGSREAAAEALISLDQPGEANHLVSMYKSGMVAQGLAPGTINRRLACLRQVVKMGKTFGFITWDLEVPNHKEQKMKDTRGPGEDAVRRMFDVLRSGELVPLTKAGTPAPAAAARNSRNLALFSLMYSKGLRRAALVSLDMEHLNLVARTVRVRLKGHHEAERARKTLGPQCVADLQAWLAIRGPQPGPVFTGRGGGRLSSVQIWRIIVAVGKAIGIKTWPHGLRHTAITAILDAGGSIRMAQRFSNHKDIKTLQIYDDNRDDLDGDASAMLEERMAGGPGEAKPTPGGKADG
jgi:integrase/recombinase XerC